MFDDEWVASARHRELSVADMERSVRAERRAIHRRRRRRRVRSLVRTMVALAVVGGIVLVLRSGDRPESSSFDLSGDAANQAWFTAVSGNAPSPSRGSGGRLLGEVVASDPAAPHEFIDVHADGTPTRYDPCRPVRFVVNPLGAPSDHRAMVDDVLATLSAASGLQLDVEGDTDEPATIRRSPFQKDRYGDRWAPVLIAWTDDITIPDLAGDAAGVGGSAAVGYGGDDPWFVSGIVYLDVDLGDDTAANRAVMMHEVGHALGLNHVDDPGQMMYPTASTTSLGVGDRAGLAALGAGVCAGLL